jgi:transcriptional regulator with XRE-family HTH domain
MARRLKSYLRTYRMSAALSQPELGRLLGVSKQAVSQYELGKRAIPANVLLASVVIFDVPGDDLFPALYESVRETLTSRSQQLATTFASRPERRSSKKARLLAEVTARIRSNA